MRDFQAERETCHALEQRFSAYFDTLDESQRPVTTQIHITPDAYYLEVDWRGVRPCSENDLASHLGRPVRFMDALSSGREFVRISR